MRERTGVCMKQTAEKNPVYAAKGSQRVALQVQSFSFPLCLGSGDFRSPICCSLAEVLSIVKGPRRFPFTSSSVSDLFCKGSSREKSATVSLMMALQANALGELLLRRSDSGASHAWQGAGST